MLGHPLLEFCQTQVVTFGIRSVVLLTSDYNAGRMTDLTLPVSRDARIIPDVLVLDRRDPELGAVVEYPDGGRRLDRIRVLVPEDLRRRRALRLAVQYYRVAHVHVDHLLRRDAKFWRRYENTNQSFLSNRCRFNDVLAEHLQANREQIGESRTWTVRGIESR